MSDEQKLKTILSMGFDNARRRIKEGDLSSQIEDAKSALDLIDEIERLSEIALYAGIMTGERARHIRKQENLSLEAFAKKIGVSKNTLLNAEKTNIISANVAEKIFKNALKIDPV